MTKSDLILSAVAVFAVTVTVVGFLCLLWTTRRRRLTMPAVFEPVTIYKPLKGADEGLEENLRSFFELDYPQIQLLFGVMDPQNQAIPVVRRLMEQHPAIDAQLVVHDNAFGLNPKVQNLLGLEPHRKHALVLISDSNVRVRPSYLKETVCYLTEPGVGLVTNLFAGVGEERFGAALENLQLNGIIASGMAIAATTGITCVVGKSMLIPARVLDEIGGLLGVRNLLAEDQVLALRVRKAGYAIRVSHHVIENVNHQRDLKWFLNRHSRWFKMRYQLARVPFLVEPLANLGAVGLLWAISGDTGLAWGGLLVLCLLGMARDAAQTWWLRGSLPAWRHVVLSPVKDLFLLPVWIDALFDRRINWRGRQLLVGPLTRLHRDRGDRNVRRRIRRIRRLRT